MSSMRMRTTFGFTGASAARREGERSVSATKARAKGSMERFMGLFFPVAIRFAMFFTSFELKIFTT
jgi:hypothetical protein